MQHCGATIGEQRLNTKERDFMGVHFNHKNNTVSLSGKTIKRLQQAPSPDNTTVEELESTVSRMMCAGGVRGESLFPYYFFLKIVRRRLSRLNRGLIRPQNQENLPTNTGEIGQNWLTTLLKNEPVHPPQQLPSTATLATYASMYGWGALLFKDSGEVLAAGGARERTPHTILQAEALAVHPALRGFNVHLAGWGMASMGFLQPNCCCVGFPRAWLWGTRVSEGNCFLLRVVWILWGKICRVKQLL
ncbi:uncharacterized protein TM35_000371400 [Trypanosoma theileri]|uniref:Uncharacterized protein n=1 Tax=Trypanosoma theileri TaxID=67003 RepID=A0A1X0NKJ4_9TRYP|nr:uncharacterized protein TM35_000371400 [Trypanosoma theileri]ORC85167.1 hypothetical protein TM35_000371400 [Trypanosoma theileri]